MLYFLPILKRLMVDLIWVKFDFPYHKMNQKEYKIIETQNLYKYMHPTTLQSDIIIKSLRTSRSSIRLTWSLSNTLRSVSSSRLHSKSPTLPYFSPSPQSFFKWSLVSISPFILLASNPMLWNKHSHPFSWALVLTSSTPLVIPCILFHWSLPH